VRDTMQVRLVFTNILGTRSIRAFDLYQMTLNSVITTDPRYLCDSWASCSASKRITGPLRLRKVWTELHQIWWAYRRCLYINFRKNSDNSFRSDTWVAQMRSGSKIVAKFRTFAPSCKKLEKGWLECLSGRTCGRPIRVIDWRRPRSNNRS